MIVADTGPVHYLVLCDHVSVLPRLFESLIIPSAVHRELLHPSAPAMVREWAGALPGWVSVRSPIERTRFENLGPGEREAISLALETRADALLIDETVGRRIAVAEGILVKGTLGVLEQAATHRLIDFTDAVHRLQQTGIFLAPDLVNAALERERIRRQAS